MSIKEQRKWEEYWIEKNLGLRCVYIAYKLTKKVLELLTTLLIVRIYLYAAHIGTYLIKIKFINVEVKYY